MAKSSKYREYKDYEKVFLARIKKNWLTTLVLTVIASIIYLNSVLTTNFESDNGYFRITPLIGIPLTMLVMLCIFVPVFMFSFKMKRRHTDSLYSMPITRTKLYLVRSLVLFIVLVPYTAAYWIGFIATAAKPNAFMLSGFVPVYFFSVILAVLLFGANAFIFTRANRPSDGIIFMALYSCATVLLMAFFLNLTNNDSFLYLTYFFRESPFIRLAIKYNAIISRGNNLRSLKYEWLIYLFEGVSGIAGWAGLLLTARREKAENAGRVSDSLWGYRVLLPFYIVTTLSLLSLRYGNLFFIGAVMILISAFAGYTIFRRSVKLKPEDWIAMGGAFVLGIIFAAIT